MCCRWVIHTKHCHAHRQGGLFFMASREDRSCLQRTEANRQFSPSLLVQNIKVNLVFQAESLNPVPSRACSTVFVLTEQFSGLQAFTDLYVFSWEINASLVLWCFKQKKNSQSCLASWAKKARDASVAIREITEFQRAGKVVPSF